MREAEKNAAAISRPRSADKGKRGRAAGMWVRARLALAARRRLAADRFGDLVKADAEDVVQQKGGAFQRRQALERQHQRQGDVVEFILLRLDQRFWQP